MERRKITIEIELEANTMQDPFDVGQALDGVAARMKDAVTDWSEVPTRIYDINGVHVGTITTNF